MTLAAARMPVCLFWACKMTKWSHCQISVHYLNSCFLFRFSTWTPVILRIFKRAKSMCLFLAFKFNTPTPIFFLLTQKHKMIEREPSELLYTNAPMQNLQQNLKENLGNLNTQHKQKHSALLSIWERPQKMRYALLKWKFLLLFWLPCGQDVLSEVAAAIWDVATSWWPGSTVSHTHHLRKHNPIYRRYS